MVYIIIILVLFQPGGPQRPHPDPGPGHHGAALSRRVDIGGEIHHQEQAGDGILESRGNCKFYLHFSPQQDFARKQSARLLSLRKEKIKEVGHVHNHLQVVQIFQRYCFILILYVVECLWSSTWQMDSSYLLDNLLAPAADTKVWRDWTSATVTYFLRLDIPFISQV